MSSTRNLFLKEEDDDPDITLAKKLSLEAHQEEGEEEDCDGAEALAGPDHAMKRRTDLDQDLENYMCLLWTKPEHMDEEFSHSLPKDSNFNPQLIAPLRKFIFNRHYGHSPSNQHGKLQQITTSLPEITPFIALQLRVARLEQEMTEVKNTDHSADVLASIRIQVPMAVDNYLGTKLDDALLKNQESEKSPKEIIRAKKEQDEEKQDSTYSIRSTDKVDLEEFDLKSALFSHMNKKKSANKNTTNYRLYHALMEALIADEDAMDKEVANKGRSTKKRRYDSAASGSAKPPPKDDDQSSMKPRESEASASKQHPTLSSTG
ncbi:hypothetical protein Tco_1475555 [Tanacetum coccineum]